MTSSPPEIAIQPSIWADEQRLPLAGLPARTTVDIVVVGAGIAGLSSAYLLGREGYKVAVIDSAAPGTGMTSRTTAHIASGVDEGWRKLLPAIGQTNAELAALAYADGIQCIHHIQDEEEIACDFVKVDGFLVGRQDEVAILDAEKSAATAAGLDNVEWAMQSPFPGSSDVRALRFPGQARLHPLKYITGLVRCIRRDGGEIYKGRATAIAETSAVRIDLQSGDMITATRAVVVANNAQLKFETETSPQELYTSYVLAGTVRKGSVPDAVCWDLEDPYHYTRLHRRSGAEYDILIFGGEDHKASEGSDPQQRYAALERWARQNFPELGSILARWSGNIKQTTDNLAFLGRSPGYQDVYIIDGDGGLGFNHATIGAKLIRDMIIGVENPLEKIFDPNRYGGLQIVLC